MKIQDNPNDLVDIATFNLVQEAEDLQHALEGKGLKTEIRDETKLQRFWFAAEKRASVHVQVPKHS